MIHHYINLVCWRPMLEIYDPVRDVVWVDTVSLHKLVSRWRDDAEYRPGTMVLSQIGPGTPQGGMWFFLTDRRLEKIAPEIQYELPFFNHVMVTDELAEVLAGLTPGTRVGIGISSPKQNHLAVMLHALRPDLEYHCLGAALAGLDTSREVAAKKLALSGSGLEWLRFLITSPRRTLGKITATLREVWSVQMNDSSRTAFEKFAIICAPTSHAGAFLQKRKGI